MKKSILLTISIFVFGLAIPGFSFAQNSDDHTAREEAEGKAVWEKLQAKELACKDLSDDNFGALGEYFMGKMAGNSHEVMNNMMIQMMGKEGEEQIHIAMGKRMSNCEPDAPMPQNMPALSGVEGINSGMMGGGNSMMGNMMTGNNLGMMAGWGWFSWIFMILFWILIIAGIVALIKWIISQPKDERKDKSPLDFLQERYAKGEISKKEFEEKKSDLI